jgi:hypothetical protein
MQCKSPDRDRSPEYLIWAEATRRKIDTAREQAQHGEVLQGDVVLAQLRAKVQTAKESAVWNESKSAIAMIENADGRKSKLFRRRSHFIYSKKGDRSSS